MTNITVTLRPAGRDDAGTLNELAALDSAAPLTGEVLLAEVDGRAVAALDVASGAVTADPFQPTVALVHAMTALRAA